MAPHSSTLAWRIPGTGSLVGCRLWGHTESDTTEATQQQQQQKSNKQKLYQTKKKKKNKKKKRGKSDSQLPHWWMKLEPIIQSEVSQKEKHQYSILTHIYGI